MRLKTLLTGVAAAILIQCGISSVQALNPNSHYQVIWAPTGDKYVFFPLAGMFIVYNAEGHPLLIKEKPVTHMAFSPNGKELAYIVPQKGIYRYRFSDKKETLIRPFSKKSQAPAELQWSRDNRHLMVWAEDKRTLFSIQIH